MAAAGIGSRVTLDANVKHLCQVGLIAVRTITGEHDGNEYAIYLPQEITSITEPSQTSQTSNTSSTQNLDGLVGLESSMTRHSTDREATARYEAPKTFSNTIDDDDTHTLDEFAGLLLEGARQILGGRLPATDQERERWKDCACVLLDELKDAAQNTVTISSVPAFFATHLRRRFARRQKTKRSLPSAGTEPASRSPENADASAKSKFTIEECRRYAEHLQKSGQGITNPGGYATTIFRTGEADALISAYLDQPAKPESPPDVSSDCPDCHGTGFWYPRGIDNGVVKCKHDRLPTAKTDLGETP